MGNTGRDGHLDQSEAYDISYLVREYGPSALTRDAKSPWGWPCDLTQKANPCSQRLSPPGTAVSSALYLPGNSPCRLSSKYPQYPRGLRSFTQNQAYEQTTYLKK